MRHCHVLTKCSSVPPTLRSRLRESDVLFSYTEAWVVVDDEEELPGPYSYDESLEILRLDRRVLQHLEDDELSVLLFLAKTERDAYLITHDRDLASRSASHVIEQRYPDEVLERLDERLNKIYAS